MGLALVSQPTCSTDTQRLFYSGRPKRSAGGRNYEARRPGAHATGWPRTAHIANRVRRTAAPAAGAGFNREKYAARQPPDGGTPRRGIVDPCADQGTWRHQSRLGYESRRGAERGHQRGDAGHHGAAGSAGRFLLAAADQRTSQNLAENAGPVSQAPVCSDSRKCGAASQCRRGHAHAFVQGPLAAALVSGGFQPQHPAGAAREAASADEEDG